MIKLVQPYEDQAAVVEFNEMQQEMTAHYNAAAPVIPELRVGDYYAAFYAQDAMWLRSVYSLLLFIGIQW